MTISKVIDGARVGLSKSLMTSPCQRKGFYGETIRDASGRRLRGPMPERVHFGAALDEAVSYIVQAERDQNAYSETAAVEVGMVRAEAGDWDEPLDADGREGFETSLRNAVHSFLYRDAANGISRYRAEYPGLRLQGDNGRTLASDDVIGTPDFLFADGSVLDLKSSGKKYTPSKFTQSAEMPTYAFLAASESGVIPPRLIYNVYVRILHPYWQWIETAGTAAHIALGRFHAAHWRAGLAAGNPDLMAFDTAYCSDCPFRAAIPEVDFAGCPIGLAVAEVEAAA